MSGSTPAADGVEALVDFGDALAVIGYGQELVDTAPESELSATLDHADAAALVARLDELRRALHAGDPGKPRRRAGLIARLTGRDLRNEAEDVLLRERVGALVASADRSADALRKRVVEQQQLQARFEVSQRTLADAIARARAWLAAHPGAGTLATMATLAPRASFERRLDQLDTLQASRDVAARQLVLLRDQNLELLARYQRIRDVLLPAWRQQALAAAAHAGAGRSHDATTAYDAIASEVDAMAVKLDPMPDRHADRSH